MGVIPDKKKLTFDDNGKFKVCVFSDMHFGERWGNGSFAAWGPENDNLTNYVHATILDQEQPDYVVFNGDIMTGENVFADNATGYMDQCFRPTVERNLPFSSTHGNHDNADHITHDEEIKYEMAHYSNLSYTRSDVGPAPYGNGNYWVPVYANADDWAPKLIMWFFDSRSFVSGSGDGPGPIPEAADFYWVDPDSVPSYIQQQSLLMKLTWGSVPPSLVFVHIPFEFSETISTLQTPGDHDDEPNPAVQGYAAHQVYTGLDLPTFDAINDCLNEGQNKVMAITSGHDHGESWCARTRTSSGITLCFDGHSGYGGYVTPHSEVRNARIFDLDLNNLNWNPTVETWLSYENKTINTQETLGPNFMATYNQSPDWSANILHSTTNE
ncbi:Metallo-dependent phosphatase-like protein [Kockovaella imperatae]|uniref:Metallo-dependent phosphatase-like protein n=1 Tax=Kockovaella imperatae TaxID=4999 RepID=A0A1Y1UCF2_9TREE|nr:Metallo-dependent phosphatase-like protein [Kockovaella imperatae]ORX35176.1 Metallo-dependent phosphatase-like protein [Kockovaella imperatae]